MPEIETTYLTRDQMHAYLVAAGFPIGRGTLDRLCSPACGEGPPVAALWPGRRHARPLYDPAAALAWAKARLKPAVPLAA